MAEKKQNERTLFFIAGILLAGPAAHWFMFDGWTPESSGVKVLVTGVQALAGIYLVYYAAFRKK
ncbi:MAG: hypothetical protein AAF573_06470 [Bacteroidota bacterium]